MMNGMPAASWPAFVSSVQRFKEVIMSRDTIPHKKIYRYALLDNFLSSYGLFMGYILYDMEQCGVSPEQEDPFDYIIKKWLVMPEEEMELHRVTMLFTGLTFYHRGFDILEIEKASIFKEVERAYDFFEKITKKRDSSRKSKKFQEAIA